MPVTIDVCNFVATVTLDRPEAMNALDPESVIQLNAAWERISADPSIRVALLTGAGERAFCTGADLKKTMPPTEGFAELHFGSTHGAPSLANLRTNKPVIGVINGFALGGGLELALQCDIRIASDRASFGLPEVCIGSIPGAGGTQRIVRAIGQSDAMLMLLTGSRIDAQEALRIGLVSRVVGAADLMETALAIAHQIAGNAPLAVSAVKRLATLGVETTLSLGLELEQQSFGLLRNSEDRLEGRKAFADKRKPVFMGK
ncbi:MAG: enoyl-CoA hydratase-related protein [Hydrogenophaga sp.]|uniref:enoyl-CoA hydratase/isomerase family protein n=1 Tax=Hydrogenophaga sp. TaxID=1904254 RepID=UPI00261EDABD|nr:enoyl-CoA hydratase-related protein [Hydrogenophaga sp.]MDM7943376.1 enoyl-CoA hydratase-related protein [Hydrogenophaga sp.]